MEEIARNHNIVLQWRINKIASWMSLKSSEINDYSWRISTVLASPYCSSSCCQAYLPSVVRPKKRLRELVLKIFFYSPEMNRSILFSMYLLRMRRRWITFFETSYAERECFPGSISTQFLLFIGTIVGGEPAGSLLCGIAFAFDRHAKSFASNFTACSSSWSSGPSVSLLFESITNLFDPWEILTQEWVQSPFRDKILIATPYLPCKQLVVTSNTGPIFVFPWIHPFGCDAASSLGRVYSRQATAWYCEISALSFVMKYCPISTTLRNPASIQNLLNLSCCDNFLFRSPYCCDRRFWFVGSSQSKETSVLITLSTSEELDCPSQRVSPFSREGIHTLHMSLRLLRKDWAGLQSTVSKSAAKCIDSFPCPLLLSWPLDNGVVARKIGHPLSANSNNILSAILSQIPWGLSSLIEYQFFSEPGPINDHCPLPNFLAYKDTSRAFAKHSFSLSFVPQVMSLNIDMNRILPVKFSGVSPNLLSKSLTSSLSCNVSNPGKMFHSNSVGSPLIPSKFLKLWEDVIHSIIFFQASLEIKFWWNFPRSVTNFAVTPNSRPSARSAVFAVELRLFWKLFTWILLIPLLQP